MIRRVAILFLIAAAACTHTSTYTNLPAPNPNGCYVKVHDRTDFGGIGDLFNGPGRWPRLEGLVNTNEESWRNRIRSLHVGAAATLTVYAEQDFKGSRSRQFPPAVDQPRLDPELWDESSPPAPRVQLRTSARTRSGSSLQAVDCGMPIGLIRRHR